MRGSNVRTTKAQHFGLGERQPEQSHTNAERVMHEWCDLVATMETLQEYGILPELVREEFVQRKKDKHGKAALFREYSRELERLHRPAGCHPCVTGKQELGFGPEVCSKCKEKQI